jgi:hypothetical protein
MNKSELSKLAESIYPTRYRPGHPAHERATIRREAFINGYRMAKRGVDKKRKRMVHNRTVI